jgi:hypothetical protein
MRRQQLAKDKGDLVSIPGRSEYASQDEEDERRWASLEQRTVVRKPCGKSIDGRGRANVPQREHCAITLEQCKLSVKKLQAQLFYARHCRSC